MRYIPVTGDIQAGKSTFADTIETLHGSAIHIETFEIIAEVATQFNKSFHPEHGTPVERINHWLGQMPGVLKKVLDIDVNYGDITISQKHIEAEPAAYVKMFGFLSLLDSKTNIARQKITSDNKEKYRPELQWIGGHLVSRVDKNIWFKEVVRRAEAEESRGVDLCITTAVKYKSDELYMRTFEGTVIPKIVRAELPTRDATDPTERESSLVTPDTILYNNGDLAQYKNSIEQFYKDYIDGTVQSAYVANDSTE